MVEQAPLPSGPINPKEKKYMDLIAVLQGAGKKPDGTYVCQDKITMYTEQLADLMIEKLNGPATTADIDEWMPI
jgi:hypothetical protein